ncbi:MAG: hypothetical protein SGI88_06010 [Candidatus Hydrogenedentes bacterium]|nr:hypothetical protein [Candidatus Hydrogenedentota bacterium]
MNRIVTIGSAPSAIKLRVRMEFENSREPVIAEVKAAANAAALQGASREL